MYSYLRPALTLLLIMTILTGVLYPAFMTAIAQTVLKEQANGSLIRGDKDQIMGSVLIGQAFNEPKYFWSRPSATLPMAYNAAASSGSNLGPTNPMLTAAVAARIHTLKQADPDNHNPVPTDLVTASGSGLDPHISVAAANYQIKRIAKVRKVSEAKLCDLVKLHTESRQWRILGEPRVNVLTLNLALDDSDGLFRHE